MHSGNYYFYESREGGADTFNQLCEDMNISRKTKSWLLSMLSAVLNIASMTAYAIDTSNMRKS
nr:unnamed protein product [Callosobruchus chinensis]